MSATIDISVLARGLAAFVECSDDLRESALQMARIIHDPEADEQEKLAASDTFLSILFPDGLEVDLNELKGDDEIEAELDAEEESFADRVRELMDERGMTQTQLAKAVGVGQPAVSNMLNRQCRPQASTIESIARALGVDPSDIWK